MKAFILIVILLAPSRLTFMREQQSSSQELLILAYKPHSFDSGVLLGTDTDYILAEDQREKT